MGTGKSDERADAKTEQLTPPDETPVIRAIAMPADTNPAGDIFGGWLMSQMDLAAGSVATRRARARCATVTVEGMTFLSPVYVGDEVSLYARLLSEGRTSMRNQGGSLAPLPRRRGGEQGDGSDFHLRRARQGSSSGAIAAGPIGRPGQIAATKLRRPRRVASHIVARMLSRPFPSPGPDRHGSGRSLRARRRRLQGLALARPGRGKTWPRQKNLRISIRFRQEILTMGRNRRRQSFLRSPSPPPASAVRLLRTGRKSRALPH